MKRCRSSKEGSFSRVNRLRARPCLPARATRPAPAMSVSLEIRDLIMRWLQGARQEQVQVKQVRQLFTRQQAQGAALPACSSHTPCAGHIYQRLCHIKGIRHRGSEGTTGTGAGSAGKAALHASAGSGRGPARLLWPHVLHQPHASDSSQYKDSLEGHSVEGSRGRERNRCRSSK